MFANISFSGDYFDQLVKKVLISSSKLYLKRNIYIWVLLTPKYEIKEKIIATDISKKLHYPSAKWAEKQFI